MMFLPITPKAGLNTPFKLTPLVFTPPNIPPTGLTSNCIGIELLHIEFTLAIIGVCSE